MNKSLNKIVSKYIITKSNKIKISSKEIIKNDIFIALQGDKFHGNTFINKALEAGAKYCITDKINNKHNFNQKILVVENVIEYLKNLSIKKRSLFKGEVIGITGSAGKTSLKELLKYNLEKQFKVSASIKSYNNYLGVILSVLNLKLNDDYAIFEIGTNNFLEIRNLTNLVKPKHIFITNILSTHLENFISQKNIAREKSDIFNKTYNKNAKILYFQMNSANEKLIFEYAIKQKIKKIIKIGNPKLDSYLVDVKKIKNKFVINLKIINKFFSFSIDDFEESKLKNLIFVLSFFVLNKINTDTVLKNRNKFPIVDGRGSIHELLINKINVKLIDQSYNANPETMVESIKKFASDKHDGLQKILILGNMNELGKLEIKLHQKVIKEIENYLFDKVILSGDSFKKALSMNVKLKNQYVCIRDSQKIMNYLKKNIHKKAILMAKCSNVTEVNKLVRILKFKRKV